VTVPGAITIQAGGNNELAFTSGILLDGSSTGGSITLNATSATADISLADNVEVKVANGSALSVNSPLVKFGQTADFNATGSSVVSFGQSSTELRAQPGSTASVITNGTGTISFNGSASFTKATGTGNSTIS